MWEWISKQLYWACNCIGFNRNILGTECEEDDVVQDVCMYLYEHKDYAQKIYEKQDRAFPLLIRLVEARIFEYQSKLYFDNKQEFFKFRKIMSVCEENGIDPIPENAYKVSAIIDDDRDYGIVCVSGLLKRSKKIRVFTSADAVLATVNCDW